MRDYEDCRPYVQHVYAEHRRLHRMLQEARAAIRQCSPEERNPRILEVLRRIRSELQQHFAEEEGGGCMDEAVCRCPSLGGELHRIEEEHPELLAACDRLIARALDAGPSVEDHTALTREFDDLCHQLHAHEAAENELLAKGFGSTGTLDENGHVPLIVDA